MEEFIKKFLRAIVSTCIYIYCKIVYRIKIIGKENIPQEGALLFCGNHRTYLDPPLITVTASRKMSFMAKEELKKNPLMRFLCYVYACIRVLTLVKKQNKRSLDEAKKYFQQKFIGIKHNGNKALRLLAA